MRTAPVALPHLDDPAAVAEAARRIGAMTHYDLHAQEACVLWSLADAGAYWTERLDEAEQSDPSRFRPNDWAVAALQAAWSAIVHTPVPTGTHVCRHLADSLTTAIGIGDDTDTVAAIAGALLGARWGASAVPAEWRRITHAQAVTYSDRRQGGVLNRRSGGMSGVDDAIALGVTGSGERPWRLFRTVVVDWQRDVLMSDQ